MIFLRLYCKAEQHYYILHQVGMLVRCAHSLNCNTCIFSAHVRNYLHVTVYIYFHGDNHAKKGLYPGADPALTKVGVTLKWRHICIGVRRHDPRKCFGIGVSETAFPAFWGHFWVKYKGLKSHCYKCISDHILKKYFGPNEIILTFSVGLEHHQIAKLNMADVT